MLYKIQHKHVGINQNRYFQSKEIVYQDMQEGSNNVKFRNPFIKRTVRDGNSLPPFLSWHQPSMALKPAWLTTAANNFSISVHICNYSICQF